MEKENPKSLKREGMDSSSAKGRKAGNEKNTTLVEREMRPRERLGKQSKRVKKEKQTFRTKCRSYVDF